MEQEKWVGKIRKKGFLIVGCALGLVLILAGSLWAGRKKSTAAESYSVSYYTETLEKRIATLCESVAGVTNVRVLLTLECSSEYVYAQNSESSSAGSSVSDYLIVEKDGEEAGVLVKEIFPRIRGVAVVCGGGDRAAVRQTLTELLSAALGVSSGKIRVAGAS